MSISTICPKCRNSYSVPDDLGGQAFTCRKCGETFEVPLPGIVYGAASANPLYNRVVGHQVPLAFEILGLHTHWSSEFSTRDVLLFLWSLRHVVLFIAALIFFLSVGDTPESARIYAVLFLLAAIATLAIACIQISSISRKKNAQAGGAADSSPLRHFVSSLLLITTDFRASIPALRTFLLGLFLLFAAFRMASAGGGWMQVFHIPPFNTPRATPNPETPDHPAVQPPPPPPPPSTAPRELPPDPEDTPLPPPEES